MVWIGWEIGTTSSGNDRFDTHGDTLGLSILLAGSVEVDWSSHGRSKKVQYLPGLAEIRPPDGADHTYRNIWSPRSSAFCLSIPALQITLAIAEEDLQAPTDRRHHLALHDGTIERIMYAMAAA